MHALTRLGHSVKDVSSEKCGWDITALPPASNGKLSTARHIEVKGRAIGQTTITVSRNEIIYGLNQAQQFILAIVLVDGDNYEGSYYLTNLFNQEPDFGVASINYDLEGLLSRPSCQKVSNTYLDAVSGTLTEWSSQQDDEAYRNL